MAIVIGEKLGINYVENSEITNNGEKSAVLNVPRKLIKHNCTIV